ncbi:MAG: phenylalanine--tRNA ligase subunit alpha, partial [Ignavibacteriae bacterium]
MLVEEIEKIKTDFKSDVEGISSPDELEKIRIKFLGRNGLVSSLFDQLKTVPIEQKPLMGKNLNELRNQINAEFNQAKTSLDINKSVSTSEIDLTLPGKDIHVGSRHILTQTLDEIKSIFKGMGFSVYEGPELESDHN